MRTPDENAWRAALGVFSGATSHGGLRRVPPQFSPASSIQKEIGQQRRAGLVCILIEIGHSLFPRELPRLSQICRCIRDCLESRSHERLSAMMSGFRLASIPVAESNISIAAVAIAVPWPEGVNSDAITFELFRHT